MHGEPKFLSRAAVVTALLSVAVVLAGAASATPPTIHTSSNPVKGVRHVKLVEKWRVGGDEGGVFFGIIAHVAADDAGRVYLLDRQLCQVFVYSADGELLSTIGKEGDGPGEVRRPGDLVNLPDGRIGLLHQARGRVTCLDPDGTPAADIILRDAQGEAQHALSLSRAERCESTLAIEGYTIGQSEEGRKEMRFLGLYDLEGRQRYEVFARVQKAFDFERRTYTERLGYNGVWALGPDGGLFLAPERDLYRIEQRGPDGALIRIIERDYAAHLRTAAEKEEITAGSSMTINGQRVPLQCEIEDRAPCISRLAVDSEGGLWVLHSESSPQGATDRVVSYDHFDAGGRYLERVEIADPADPDHDRLVMLDPGHFVVLRRISDAWRAFSGQPAGEDEGGGTEPLEVVYYQAAD